MALGEVTPSCPSRRTLLFTLSSPTCPSRKSRQTRHILRRSGPTTDIRSTPRVSHLRDSRRKSSSSSRNVSTSARSSRASMSRSRLQHVRITSTSDHCNPSARYRGSDDSARAQGSTSTTSRRSPPWHRLQSHACRPGTKTEFSSTFRILKRRHLDRTDESILARWTGWWQTPVLGMAYTNLDLALGNKGSSEVPNPQLTHVALLLRARLVILGAAQHGRTPETDSSDRENPQSTSS